MKRIAPALALFLFATSAAAQSAPFCLVDAAGTRCQYYSLPDCQRDARAMQGGCVVNNNRGGNQGSSGGDWFNNATRAYETGRQQREARQPPQAPPQVVTSQPAIDPRWMQFCERMQQNDMDVLSHWGDRLSPEEREVATRMYANRGTYCRSLAQ